MDFCQISYSNIQMFGLNSVINCQTNGEQIRPRKYWRNGFNEIIQIMSYTMQPDKAENNRGY